MSEIIVKKLTDANLMREAAGTTSGKESNLTLEKIYKSEHSPIRTQIFKVEMIGIPTACSVHFVRHKIGVEHFVRSNRPDRGGDAKADRDSPVNHTMILNAESLINIARKRLCYKASKETREIMKQIKVEVAYADYKLAKFLVPACIYRGGMCPELKPCGNLEKLKELYSYYFDYFQR